jgi:hypothetical protein
VTGQPTLLDDDLQPATAALPPRRRKKRAPRRPLTPLEKAAAINRDETLADITERAPDWTFHEVKKAAVAAAREHDTISANQLRGWLPEEAGINVGAAIRALANAGVLVHTGQYVPSDLDGTHGHRICVYAMHRADDGEVPS